MLSEINISLSTKNIRTRNKMNKFYSSSNWFLIVVTVISSWAAVDAFGQDVLVELALPLSIDGVVEVL